MEKHVYCYDNLIIGGSLNALLCSYTTETPIIIDDLIASGSIYQHADSLVTEGANPAYISITHPVLTGNSTERLNRPSIHEIVTTNTIPVPAEKQIDGKVRVRSIAPLLAEAILRIHQHKSVSKVFLDQQVIFPV